MKENVLMKEREISTSEEFQEYLTYAQKNNRNLSRREFIPIFSAFRRSLNKGMVKSVEKIRGEWRVNSWVRDFILLGFRFGQIKSSFRGPIVYFDKDTLPVKNISLDDGIRLVPGGTSIRDGCYIAKGVICMPPVFINIGAYVDEGTLVDSNVLIGSCAHVGKNVHLSAGVQLGGVMEPPGKMPVIIEDNVFIGGSSGIFGEIILKEGVVIGAGTILTDSIPVYDLVKGEVYRKSSHNPLIIPPNAVVVPGSRMYKGTSKFEGISIQTAVIVKYGSDSISLESMLRK